MIRTYGKGDSTYDALVQLQTIVSEDRLQCVANATEFLVKNISEDLSRTKVRTTGRGDDLLGAKSGYCCWHCD